MNRTELIPAHSKETAHTASRRCSRGLLRSGFASLALLVAANFSAAFAFGDDRKQDNPLPPPPPPPPPPLTYAGDETIGTLPILQGQAVVDPRRNLAIHEPSLCLEGELYTILNSISFSRGNVQAQVISTDPSSGRVCLVFPGNVQIGFDKLMIESSSIRVGIWTPGRSGSNLEAVWSDRRAMVGTSAAFSDLPILSMSTAGALSSSPLLLMSHGSGSWTTLLATTTQDFLIVRQSH